MPSLPNLRDLPPETLARLTALNPELRDALRALDPQVQADVTAMATLQSRMMAARDAALSSYLALALYQPPPLPEKKHLGADGAQVFRYVVATAACIYILAKAGAL